MQFEVTIYTELPDFEIPHDQSDNCVVFTVRARDDRDLDIRFATVDGELVDDEQLEELIEYIGIGTIKADAFCYLDIA